MRVTIEIENGVARALSETGAVLSQANYDGDPSVALDGMFRVARKALEGRAGEKAKLRMGAQAKAATLVEGK